MTKDDLHYLITRLNGVAGILMNHASGVKQISPERADVCYDMLMEMENRIRKMDEESSCSDTNSDATVTTTSAAPIDTSNAVSSGAFDVIGDVAGACLDVATSVASGTAEAVGEIISGICD